MFVGMDDDLRVECIAKMWFRLFGSILVGIEKYCDSQIVREVPPLG